MTEDHCAIDGHPDRLPLPSHLPPAYNRGMTERRRDWFSPLLLVFYLAMALGFIGLVCFGVFKAALPDRSASSQPPPQSR